MPQGNSQLRIATLAGMARTENDTWDLATSVGATATMVAAGRGRATLAGLIDDPYAEPLVRAVGVDFFTRWANGELSADEVDIPGHPWGMQPMTDLLAVRTRLIDQFITDATASGIRQAVILASGLDARGYRLSWPAETVVFEIDQRQVTDFKTATLAAAGAEPTVDLRAVPIDLRDDWPAALRQAGFDAHRPTDHCIRNLDDVLVDERAAPDEALELARAFERRELTLDQRLRLVTRGLDLGAQRGPRQRETRSALPSTIDATRADEVARQVPHRLRGQRTIEDAGATERSRIDQRDTLPEICGADRTRDAGRPTTDDDYVLDLLLVSHIRHFRRFEPLLYFL